MRIGLTGQSALSAVTRTGLVALTLLITGVLAACTTVEGTNALTDPGTFEREVMTPTAQGFGLVGKGPGKEEPKTPRAPLAWPRNGTQLPAPTTSVASALPVDSDSVQIDTTNLTEADMTRLRNARVVDLRTLSGRPLTEAETRQLTAGMRAANMDIKAGGARPLYLPPEDYFVDVGGRDAICKAKDGSLVPINSNQCPAEIREALKNNPSLTTGIISTDLNKTNTRLNNVQ
ncbi:hypothetical protein [Devosia sp.]|uniref:hypothetical protein n=1 Tax=Devosia sp. TaxID=1871048 RepID=UPI0032663970